MGLMLSGYNDKLEKIEATAEFYGKYPKFKELDAGERKAWASAFADKMKERKSEFAEYLDYFTFPDEKGESKTNIVIPTKELKEIWQISAGKLEKDLKASVKHAIFATGSDGWGTYQEPIFSIQPKPGFFGTPSQEPIADTAKRAAVAVKETVKETVKDVAPKIGLGIGAVFVGAVVILYLLRGK